MPLPAATINTQNRTINIQFDYGQLIDITDNTSIYNFNDYVGYAITINGNKSTLRIDMTGYNFANSSTWYNGLVMNNNEYNSIIVTDLKVKTNQFCSAVFLQSNNYVRSLLVHRCDIEYDDLAGTTGCGGLCGENCSGVLTFEVCYFKGNVCSGAFVGPGYGKYGQRSIKFDDCTCVLRQPFLENGGYVGTFAGSSESGSISIFNSTMICNNIPANSGGFIGSRADYMNIDICKCTVTVGTRDGTGDIDMYAGGFVGSQIPYGNIRIQSSSITCNNVYAGGGGLVGAHAVDGGSIHIVDTHVDISNMCDTGAGGLVGVSAGSHLNTDILVRGCSVTCKEIKGGGLFGDKCAQGQLVPW